MKHEVTPFTTSGVAGLPAGNGTSDVLNVDDRVDKWIQVTNGNRTATVEGTINNSVWIPIQTVPASTNAFVEVPQAVRKLRITISAHAAGTSTAHLASRDARSS